MIQCTHLDDPWGEQRTIWSGTKTDLINAGLAQEFMFHPVRYKKNGGYLSPKRPMDGKWSSNRITRRKSGEDVWRVCYVHEPFTETDTATNRHLRLNADEREVVDLLRRVPASFVQPYLDLLRRHPLLKNQTK